MTKGSTSLPHSQDEVVYLFQAKVLSTGNLYLPSLPGRLRFFFDHEFVVNNGKWYGKYSPGQSIAFLPAMSVGAPWLANALAGGVTLLLLFLLAHRFFSLPTAMLTALLFSLSPFSVLMSASFLSHQTAQLLTVLFFLALLRGVTSDGASRSKRWSAVAGFAGGAIFVVRPYNALVLLPFAAIYASHFLTLRGRSWRRRLEPLLWFALPAAALAALNLGYNLALTGHPLRFPYQVYSRLDFVGFGLRGVEWGSSFGPTEAKANVIRNWRALRSLLFAWPSDYLAAAIPLAFLSRRRVLALFLLALLPLQVLAYALYFHPGTFMGPRYWYEAIWVLPLLTAEGTVVAFAWLRRLLRRPWIWAVFATGMLMLLCLSLGWDLWLLPAFRGYNRMSRAQLSPLQRPALVFVPSVDRWQDYGRYFILQSPGLDDDVIFARDQGRHNVWKNRLPVPNEELIRYFPTRHVYVIVR